MKKKVITSFTKIKDNDLVEVSQTIVSKMTSNTNFQNPPLTIQFLRTQMSGSEWFWVSQKATSTGLKASKSMFSKRPHAVLNRTGQLITTLLRA